MISYQSLLLSTIVLNDYVASIGIMYMHAYNINYVGSYINTF